MASQGTLAEALGCIEEVARDLVFYETPLYKQATEQAILAKCQTSLEKCRPVLIANAEAITNADWRNIASLVGPLAHCLLVPATPQYTASAKARHSSGRFDPACSCPYDLALFCKCHGSWIPGFLVEHRSARSVDVFGHPGDGRAQTPTFASFQDCAPSGLVANVTQSSVSEIFLPAGFESPLSQLHS